MRIWNTIALLGVLTLIAALAAAQPTPFVISGWVNCTNGDPMDGPNVTVTNLNTDEAFIASANASSNYYQIVTSSDNVSVDDVLCFNVSDGNSTEFNHTVILADMTAGGIVQNATIECGGQPTPFVISGWVNCTNGDPMDGPNVTVTNLNTDEAFIASANASSNYYQIVTSSDNVSVDDVLCFNVSDGNSTEFNHTVILADMTAGGFMQNATIECGGPGLCGDATGDGVVDMTDVMTVWYDFADYPTPGAFTISDEWAADANCDGVIDMTDVMTIWYDFADYPTPGAYVVNCC